ncbi:MAG TPA: Gfo/Idh/MocA family oxidoreductase [Chitinophagaceae bacterium]|nr:Gfo/Idh/MocA family oxidoreductase [Chitinophagaceae bacterium]
MEKYQVALCSFGMSGKVFHAPFLQVHPGLNFYAVWERAKNLATEIYPGVKTFRSFEEMLADKTIDLVIINTPSYTHFDFTKKVLLADKHAVVEKPFTATTSQAEELISLAKKVNKKLSVYQNRRYDSDYKTVKKILDEELLGKIVDAEIHYDRFNPQLSPKEHKEIPGPAVGCLYDLGSHLIDQAIQFFGMPLAVSADITINRPGSLADDYFDLKLFYPEHRMTLKSSYFVREPLPGYIFHGRKGSFIKAKTDVQEINLTAGKLPEGDDWGKEPATEMGFLHTEKDGIIIKKHIPSLQGNYMEYYNGIYEALANNSAMPVTAADGLKVIRLIEAAMKSNKERKVIDL